MKLLDLIGFATSDHRHALLALVNRVISLDIVPQWTKYQKLAVPPSLKESMRLEEVSRRINVLELVSLALKKLNFQAT